MNEQIEQQPAAPLYKVPAMQSMTPSLRSVLGRWTIATVGGVIIGWLIVVSQVVLWLLDGLGIGVTMTLMIVSAATVLPLARFQRRVLRYCDMDPSGWTRATVGSFAVISLIVFLVLGNEFVVLSWLLDRHGLGLLQIAFFGLLGATLGFAQWLTIHKEVLYAVEWIAGGGLSGLLFGVAIIYPMGGTIGLILALMAYCAINGVLLWRLVDRTNRES